MGKLRMTPCPSYYSNAPCHEEPENIWCRGWDFNPRYYISVGMTSFKIQ